MEGAAPVALSAPAYPYRKSGTVLVLGFSSHLQDDFARAKALRPDAEIIACNKAAGFTKAFAIFSQHVGPDKLGVWAKWQREKFGDDFEVHGPGWIQRLDAYRQRYPYIDYVWPQAKGTGTSPWAAAKMAKMMGFSEIILCGVSLERGGYADGTLARDFRSDAVLKIYRGYIKKDVDWHAGVKAMSGWPREFFGEPS